MGVATLNGVDETRWFEIERIDKRLRLILWAHSPELKPGRLDSNLISSES